MAIDHFRRNKKMKMVRSRDEMDVFANLDTGDSHVEDLLVEDQIHTDVRRLIDELPVDQREVRMRMYDNLSFRKLQK